MPKEALLISLEGSVDLDGKPFTIDDKDLRKSQNLIPDRDGHLIRRGTMMYESSLLVSYPFLSDGGILRARTGDGAIGSVFTNPIWLGVPNFGGGVFVIATAKNGERMDLAFNSGDKSGLKAIVANALLTAPELLPTIFGHAGITYIIYGPNTYGTGVKIVPESDPAYPGFKVVDFNFAGSDNTIAPFLAANYKGRVVYGNFGSDGDRGSTCVFSDYDEPLVIGNSALTDRNFIVGSRDGDKLTALHTVMMSAAGTPAQTGVLALKTYSAYLLVGEPTETDDVDYFGSLQINKLSSNAGCVAQGSIVDTPYGTIWCGPDDVWFLPFGSVPIPIGRKLRPLLKAQPVSQRFRIHAVYADGFYRLALFSPGQGPNYDAPLGEQWWLDLRGGPPESYKDARWFGPQVFKVAGTLATERAADMTVTGTSYMATDQRPGANRVLYGAQAGLVPNGTVGDPEGPTALVTYDNPNARDISGTFRGGLVRWEASHAYNVGDEIIFFKNTTDLHPRMYRCTGVTDPNSVNNVSGLTEPVWTDNDNDIQADGDVTWTLQGFVLSPSSVLGSEATISLHSKEFDADTGLQDKLWEGAEASILLTIPERLTLIQLIDAGDVIDIITKDVDPLYGPMPGPSLFWATPVSGNLLDPLNPSLAAVFNEKFNSMAFRSVDGTRKIGSTNQIQFSETPGILIPSQFDTLTVEGNGIEYEIPGWAGTYYANAAALLTAVTLACQAAIDDGTLTAGGTHGLFSITSNGVLWRPILGTVSDRYIWMLLGYTDITKYATPAVIQYAREIVYDVAIGAIGINDLLMRLRTFKRRPSL